MSELQTLEDKSSNRKRALDLVNKYSPDHTKMISVRVNDKLILYFPQGTSQDKIKKSVEKHKNTSIIISQATRKALENVKK